jgi:DNA polymerase (family 10)
MAKSFGVPIVISSDAHSAIELDFIEFGIKQARRGWLEKSDVLNTFSFDQLIRKLNSGR